MIYVCPGGWSDEVRHAPATIGARPPESDTRSSHGCCDPCARAMGATIPCRWCGSAKTADGLCARCEKILMVLERGRPTVLLTVYRQAGAVSCAYDGAGAVTRLRAAMRSSEYRAFTLEKIPVEVARG